VARFAVEKVQPKVTEMDEKEKVDPEILRGLFEQGVRSGKTECSDMYIMAKYIYIISKIAHGY
jgi:hypothetical protein